MRQKRQPPEEFCRKRCSRKFRKIHGKIPMSESLKVWDFIKKAYLAHMFSCEFCEIINIFFAEHLRATAFVESNFFYFAKYNFSAAKFMIFIAFESRNKTCSKIAVSEAAIRRCSLKKESLKISQNLQDNTCAGVYFNRRTGLWCFHMNLWTAAFENHVHLDSVGQ